MSSTPELPDGAARSAVELRAVLTGATGAIGWYVAEAFIKSGVPTMALLRRAPGDDGLPDGLPVEHRLIGSLHDPGVARQVRAFRPTTFIHCAWHGVPGRQRNEPDQFLENIPLTLNALSLARSAGCTHWIGLGSQAEYGARQHRICEAQPPAPVTAYGQSKLAASIIAAGLCAAWNMSFSWLRVFSTYGPRDSADWLLAYVIREFRSGRRPRLTPCEQVWDYLYTRDAAAAVLAVARRRAEGTYNLGSGTARPLKEFVETIRQLMPEAPEPDYGAVPYRPDQVMHLEASIHRIVAATGWQPTTPLFEGLRECLSQQCQT